MKVTKEELTEALLSRWKYEPYLIDDAIKTLTSMDELIVDAFDSFFESNRYPKDPKFFGLSAFDIKNNYKFVPPAVFMMLDWISKDPNSALDSLVREYHKPLPSAFEPVELYEWNKAHQK